MCATDRIQPGQQRAQGEALLLGGHPVARPVLVLLAVEVLLAARSHGDMLVELESAVDPIGGGQSRGQDCPDGEGSRAPVLEVLGEDVRGVGEEVGSASDKENDREMSPGGTQISAGTKDVVDQPAKQPSERTQMPPTDDYFHLKARVCLECDACQYSR